MSEYIFYIAYEPTGKITRTGQCSQADLDNWPIAGEQAIEGQANDSIHYLYLTDPDNPIIADKTPVPHTVNGTLITDLPGDELHCVVTGPVTDSFAIPAGETELEYAPEAPGTYVLTLSGVKYLPTTVTINA